MGIQWVEIDGQFINPANVTRVRGSATRRTQIYFVGVETSFTVELSVVEVMRRFRGIPERSEPDVTYYGEPL